MSNITEEATLDDVLERVRSVASVGVYALAFLERESFKQKSTDEEREETHDSYQVLTSLFNDLGEKYGIKRTAIPLARLISHLNTISDTTLLTEIGVGISDVLYAEEVPKDLDGMVQRTIVEMVLREQKGR
jgi:hypothetical protein